MLISIIQHAASSRGLRALGMLSAMLLSTLTSAVDAPTTYGEMDAAAFEEDARETYTLQDFSDRYRATLEIAVEGGVFRPGVINVYDKKGDKALIRVQSDELVLHVDAKTGDVKANELELPYGQQGVLIYRDFNFDGIKDLALMDGQNSCYQGPSFQVFLGTANGFKHSDSYTQLAQENCGMFGVDEKKREISTMTKDGCCWHQMVTYSVYNGEPSVETETVIDQSGNTGFLPAETVGVYKNGKMTYTTRVLWEEDDQREILLAFKLAPSGKRIVLFRPTPSEPVFYAAIDAKNEVGLIYPQSENERFSYDAASHALSFVRGDTTYRILADEAGVPSSMQAVIRGKATELKLQSEPAEGSLDKVAQALKDAGE